MDDITLLTIREVQNLNIARIGQIALDPVYTSAKCLFAVDETGVNGKLTPLEPVVQKKIPKGGRRFALRFGVCRQIEHYKYTQSP